MLITHVLHFVYMVFDFRLLLGLVRPLHLLLQRKVSTSFLVKNIYDPLPPKVLMFKYHKFSSLWTNRMKSFLIFLSVGRSSQLLSEVIYKSFCFGFVELEMLSFTLFFDAKSLGLWQTLKEIKNKNKDAQLKSFEADMSSFESIFTFKNSLEQWLSDSALHPSIQVLVNNAGILATSSRPTIDGYDR